MSDEDYDKDETDAEASAPTVEELIERSQTLLDELQAFKQHLEDQRLDTRVELATFRSSVKSELTSLKRLAARNASQQDSSVIIDDDDLEGVTVSKNLHSLRSSNVPFLEALWATAKRSRGVVAFSKRFYWQVPAQTEIEKAKGSTRANGGKQKWKNGHAPVPSSRGAGRNKRYASVEIVADGGAEWIKISSMSQKRLLFELAAQGWPSSSEDGERDNDKEVDDKDKSSLVRMAEGLIRASKATRYRYRHPRIRFVLSKVVEGEVPQIDSILNSVRRMGITVETISDTPDTMHPDFNPPISPEILCRLSPDPFPVFTATLNIDCTILLALASDLSHTEPKSLTPQPWHHRALLHQMEREHEETLLPSVMYPAMGGKKLVCTEEAAVRMREIVETIGTPTEKARTALLLGDHYTLGKGETKSLRSILINEMQQLSDHPVPSEWQLPIRIVSKDSENVKTTIDIPEDLAALVEAQLTSINQSVFMFGWRNGYTTLSSNRTVARQIERVVDEWLDDRERLEQESRGANGAKQLSMKVTESMDEPNGPDIWLCGTSRSLIGKEKGRKS